MAQIPTYQSRQSTPRSLGTQTQQVSGEAQQATQKALEEIESAAAAEYRQDVKTAIVDAEVEFQEQAREEWQNLSQLKGKDAVANQATGRPGVYSKTDEALSKIKSQYENHLPGEYQSVLERRLENKRQQYLSKAAQKEEQERSNLQTYNANSAIQEAENRIQDAGGNPEDYKQAIKDSAEQIRVTFGDNYRSEAKVREMKAGATKTAILSSLSSGNPELAREHLENNKDLFNAESVKTFRRMIKEGELKQQVSSWTEKLQDLPYQEQLARIEEIQDQQLQEAVFRQVNNERTIEETRKKERQNNHYQELWERAFMAKHDPDQYESPTIQGILDDPVLSTSQKEHLMNVIGGQEESPDRKAVQNRTWYDFHSRINSGRNVPSRREIFQASADGRLTPGMTRSLLREIEDGTDFPSLGKAKDHLRFQLREKSEVIDSDERWKDFQRDLEIWAYQRKRETGKNPSYDEIMQMGEKLAEEPKDKSWWPFYTGTPPSPYRRDELPHYRQLMRPEGVPEDAQWSSNAGAYLFERNGDTYAAVPQGNDVRMFRRSGSQQEQR